MRKVKVGIVGIGRLGRQHAENLAFRVPKCELTAACSLGASDVEKAQSSWNIPYGYTNYDEMLENEELNAIFIASPSNFHCAHITKAVKTGFHVFSEKTLGLDLCETLKVKKVVEAPPKNLLC